MSKEEIQLIDEIYLKANQEDSSKVLNKANDEAFDINEDLMISKKKVKKDSSPIDHFIKD